MRIDWKMVDDIKPYWRNPRHNANTVEVLKESIQKFGFLNPILIDEHSIIITGHARYKAVRMLVGTLDEHINKLASVDSPPIELIENLKKIHAGKIPTSTVAGLTEKQIKEFRIADNKIHELSKWNIPDLEAELRELGSVVGFEEGELDKLIKDLHVDYEGYTPEEIAATSQELDERFTDISKVDYLEVICPECKKQFNINRADLLRS